MLILLRRGQIQQPVNLIMIRFVLWRDPIVLLSEILVEYGIVSNRIYCSSIRRSVPVEEFRLKVPSPELSFIQLSSAPGLSLYLHAT